MDEYFDVEEILDYDEHKKRYHIKWKGFPASESTWEQAKDLKCQRLLDEFERRYYVETSIPYRSRVFYLNSSAKRQVGNKITYSCRYASGRSGVGKRVKCNAKLTSVFIRNDHRDLVMDCKALKFTPHTKSCDNHYKSGRVRKSDLFKLERPVEGKAASQRPSVGQSNGEPQPSTSRAPSGRPSISRTSNRATSRASRAASKAGSKAASRASNRPTTSRAPSNRTVASQA